MTSVFIKLSLGGGRGELGGDFHSRNGKIFSNCHQTIRAKDFFGWDFIHSKGRLVARAVNAEPVLRNHPMAEMKVGFVT
jgi:hypothetical protein